MSRRVVGILGGAFDPPHIGHANVVRNVLSSKIVDELWFVPSADGRYDKSSLASQADRVEMLERLKRDLFNKDSRISISKIQFDPALASSATVDLMDHLKRIYPDNDFVFLVGEDNVPELSKWKESRRLLSENKIVVVPRLGVPKVELPSGVSYIDSDPVLENDMSSTSVRDLLSTGGDVSKLLSPSVIDLIRTRKLYIQPPR